MIYRHNATACAYNMRVSGPWLMTGPDRLGPVASNTGVE